MSPQKARDEYGVVIDTKTFVVDEEATKKLRADIASKRGPAVPFDSAQPGHADLQVEAIHVEAGAEEAARRPEIASAHDGTIGASQ